MTEIMQHVVNAISLGSLFALFSLGIALIFGVARIINFALGEFLTFAGYTIFVTVGFMWLPIFVVIAAILVVVILALVMERIAFRPLREAPATTLLIVSFSLSNLLTNILLTTAGGRAKTVDFGSQFVTPISIGSVRMTLLDLVTIGVTVTLILALSLVLRYTKIGIQLRAAAEDFGMAKLLGVRANVVVASAFAISGVLAAVAGIILTVRIATLTPSFGNQAVIVAFIATVIGGLGSLTGAALGGFFIGVLTIFLEVVLPSEFQSFRDSFVFGLILVVLLIRPNGFIPTPTGERA
jgi:branched-chain amino acid transport system permease protein